MDNINDFLALLLRPGTFVLGIAVYILTFFTKRVVEVTHPKWKPSKGAQQQASTKEVVKVKRYANKMAMWWNEVLLPAVPIVWGMLAGFLSSEFLFGPANNHIGERMMWSCGISWFSSFLYAAIRKLALQKVGVDIQPESIAPPPGG